MPHVTGIVETALYVEDLARSEEWYERVFGFPRLMEDERMCAYGVADRHVLLLFRRGGSTEPTPMHGGLIPAHDGRGTIHLAFAIAASELASWEDWLAEQSIEVESKLVCSKSGGTSLYFRDPDKHLVELITPGCWTVY